MGLTIDVNAGQQDLPHPHLTVSEVLMPTAPILSPKIGSISNSRFIHSSIIVNVFIHSIFLTNLPRPSDTLEPKWPRAPLSQNGHGHL